MAGYDVRAANESLTEKKIHQSFDLVIGKARGRGRHGRSAGNLDPVASAPFWDCIDQHGADGAVTFVPGGYGFLASAMPSSAAKACVARFQISTAEADMANQRVLIH